MLKIEKKCFKEASCYNKCYKISCSIREKSFIYMQSKSDKTEVLLPIQDKPHCHGEKLMPERDIDGDKLDFEPIDKKIGETYMTIITKEVVTIMGDGGEIGRVKINAEGDYIRYADLSELKLYKPFKEKMKELKKKK